jgi:type II secretion system protein J
MYVRESGFTIVEVLVASVIGAFVALVAVGTLRAVSASSEMIDNNIATSSEARFAARMIAQDLMNLYRDNDSRKTKLVGLAEEMERRTTSYLCLYTVGRTKARIAEPEGDVYEVEYSLRTKDERRALTRRIWPNPDKDALPGGILTEIAQDIDLFEVGYYDGEKWQSEWPEEMESLPRLVEVTIVASRRGREDSAMESFVVSFPRSPWRNVTTAEEEEGEGG